MQNLMRRHKKWFLLFLILFIGIPMLFFGIPSFFGQSSSPHQDQVLATVGGMPIFASEFRRTLDQEAQRRSQQTGERPAYAELAADGTADQVLQALVDRAFISIKEQERGYTFRREILEENLKKLPMVQDENGNFNPEAWNFWIQQGNDWNAIYAEMQNQLTRDIFLETITAAAARVLDKELEEALEDNETKLRIRYIRVEPPVSLDEEVIRAHYEEHSENYRSLDQKTAEFSIISLRPDPPAIAFEVLERAQAGEDFAELADEYSDISAGNGGEMGWMRQGISEPDHRRPLYELAAGEVSELVPAPSGYYIYKIDEEREDEDTGEREVFARQILFRVDLDEEERENRLAMAQSIADELMDSDDFASVLETYNLPYLTTGSFNNESIEIEGIPANDARNFRISFQGRDPEDFSVEVITGQGNIYLARLIEVIPGTVQPFEEVRDRVESDATLRFERSDEYQELIAEYATRIKEQAESLDDIMALFPELEAVPLETREFNRQEYLFQDQVYLQTAEVYEAVGRGEPGQMAGPLQGFLGDTYFIELIERTSPSMEDRELWTEKLDELRTQMMNMYENALLQDYLLDLRERSMQRYAINTNPRVLENILGLGSGTPATTETEFEIDLGELDLELPSEETE